MKTEVYLHVGFPRTATTFFQNEIFPNIKDLNYQHTLKRNFEVRPGKNLLSNEDLLGKPYLPSDFDRQIYLNALAKMYPKAKIIVGMREQDKMFKSMYTIFVKSGWSGNYKEAKEIMKKKYKVKEVFGLLEKLWNKKDIYIFHFEDFIKDKKQCVEDLCSFIGVEAPEFKDRKVNVAWTERQLRLGTVLNKINTQPGKFEKTQGIFCNKFFIELLQENGNVKRALRKRYEKKK